MVDRRRTVGTWFFGGALVVLLGSSPGMPEPVRLAANMLWALLAVAVIVGQRACCAGRSSGWCGERFPNTEERMGSLYFYVVMRAITFRRMRIPEPRVEPGRPGSER